MSDTVLPASSRMRVENALNRLGIAADIVQFGESTRSSAEAAAAIGCEVAQIAKSIVFRCGMRAAVVITSGANRVDQLKAEAALGVKLGRADADWVRQATGFAIGGVAPVGHVVEPMLLLDADLMALEPVWAAAGSPSHVFRTSAAELLRMTGAKVAAVKAASDR
jgi:prolyl-tRNA editing enzyme YbaK/EbsC (Cys-tRNA(Pro) deacylase)